MTRFFTENSKFQFLVLLKKFRETLFTSKLHNAELLSFWHDFSQKIQNSHFGLCVTKTTSSGNFRYFWYYNWSSLIDATLIHCRDPLNGTSLLHSLLHRRSRIHRKLNKDGYEELLEFLLTKIDVNITDNHGATPLHYCCRYVHFPSENLLKLLLKQSNINVNATMTYTRYSFDNR